MSRIHIHWSITSHHITSHYITSLIVCVLELDESKVTVDILPFKKALRKYDEVNEIQAKP